MPNHIRKSLYLAILVFIFSLHSSFSSERKATVIALIGDSTVTDESGWGSAFANHFDKSVTVTNFAVGGRSSKSWFDEGRLPEALEIRPDFVFIQFGHNDQPGKGPDRETDPNSTYRENIIHYIDEFRQIGSHPIIVSSVTRRNFNDSGQIQSTLGPWAEAARSAAKQANATFLDLHSLSIAYHNAIGPQASHSFNPTEADVTHFNNKGAEAIADLIISLLRSQELELCNLLKSDY
ncbi:rhamnogalacturonan acetylesterase [Pelagicoccus mobilis]|uniref:Rhamnogalacturonan acetylesterase n=1 Tax=Pelagicoccus mobilis TaxID=415221 RepID=A0A934S3I1_9BACT|nr:rhamnogalacturonan acetylesterase [Pelagicoccus mobilis]MBK1878373.1 rhamnogalacturonan acetylesterase [Pelagicoccus mobilis]